MEYNEDQTISNTFFSSLRKLDHTRAYKSRISAKPIIPNDRHRDIG